MWHGVVQRTVSGEARSFEAKDEIIEVLEAMLYQDQPVRTGQRGKTGTKAGLRAGGNNQSEANEATEGSR
jgi:hypothetical protein